MVRFVPVLAITGLNQFAPCHPAFICFLECCCFSRTCRFPGSAMKVIFQINFQNGLFPEFNLASDLHWPGVGLGPTPVKSPSFSLTCSFWWDLGTLRRTGREQEQAGTPLLCASSLYRRLLVAEIPRRGLQSQGPRLLESASIRKNWQRERELLPTSPPNERGILKQNKGAHLYLSPGCRGNREQ